MAQNLHTFCDQYRAPSVFRRKGESMRQKILFAGCLAGCICLMAGCTASKTEPTPMPQIIQPQAYTEPEQRVANPGSLFDEGGSHLLFADGRARRVGDIVMINIVETSKGKNKAETKTEKDSSINLGVGSLFGRQSTSPLGLLEMPLMTGKVGPEPILRANSASQFDGTGETTRENNVRATIAARVLRVHPGGVLELEGTRETRVNEETQYIVVTGLARARDIAPDNSIMSTQLADAHVAYYGKGVVTDKQKPGWFVRLMDFIWPF